jgi:rhodanese-related sulfurtransferase
MLSTAAAACALDLDDLFLGSGRPAALPELLAAVPAAPAPSEAPEPGNCDFPLNIGPEEARRFIQAKNPVVIDIRTAEEHAAGHIEPTHLVLDYYAPDFKAKLAGLDRSAKYLIYCRSGRRSGAALLTMKDLGFADMHDIAGGITAWTAAGLPVVKP